MNGLILFEAMSFVGDRHIVKAAVVKRPKNSGVWKKWAAAAACAALVIGLSIPILSRYLSKQPSDVDDVPLAPISVMYFDPYGDPYIKSDSKSTAIYEDVTDSASALQKFGLDADDLEANAGEYLGKSELDREGEPKEVEVYSHKKYECGAVLIAQKPDGEYRLMLFCNFVATEDSEAHSAAEKLSLFGANSADDVAAIEHTDWHRTKTLCSVSDRGVIERFYSGYAALNGISNAEYQADVFGNKSEEEQQRLGNEIADSLEVLRIRLNSGLCFYVDCYPEIGYLAQDLDYYRPDDALIPLIQNELLSAALSNTPKAEETPKAEAGVNSPRQPEQSSAQGDITSPAAPQERPSGEYATSDVFCWVAYAGQIYKQQTSAIPCGVEQQEYAGDYIGSARGDFPSSCFSQGMSIDELRADEGFSDLSSNFSGEVFAVKGYDVGDRICIFVSNAAVIFLDSERFIAKHPVEKD